MYDSECVRPTTRTRSSKHDGTDQDFITLGVYNPTFTFTQSTYRKMKIEWASSFRSDGTRRRPPPSSMHGWLAKMRGTLLGDEALRSKGMAEMRDARDARKRRKSHRASSGRSICSIFSFYMGPSKKPIRHPTGSRGNSARPTYRTHEKHQSYRSHRSHTGVKPSSYKSSNPSRASGSTGKTHRKPSSRSRSH